MIKRFCDKCGEEYVYRPMAKLTIASRNEATDYTADLCNTCVGRLKRWIYTPL